MNLERSREVEIIKTFFMIEVKEISDTAMMKK